MQRINKTSVGKIFAHTWYIYPVSAILITLLWLWGFQAFHQPSSHQKLHVFFATEVKNNSFLKDIQNKYEREKLREISNSYGLPASVGFTTKLQVAINTADIIILDETTLNGFNDHHQNYFLEMNDYVKSYLSNEDNYFTYNEKDYGVLLKAKDEESWLEQYMVFEEGKDYYLTLSIASQNLGKAIDEGNNYYDNALTIMKYLISENG